MTHPKCWFAAASSKLQVLENLECEKREERIESRRATCVSDLEVEYLRYAGSYEESQKGLKELWHCHLTGCKLVTKGNGDLAGVKWIKLHRWTFKILWNRRPAK